MSVEYAQWKQAEERRKATMSSLPSQICARAGLDRELEQRRKEREAERAAQEAADRESRERSAREAAETSHRTEMARLRQAADELLLKRQADPHWQQLLPATHLCIRALHSPRIAGLLRRRSATAGAKTRAFSRAWLPITILTAAN